MSLGAGREEPDFSRTPLLSTKEGTFLPLDPAAFLGHRKGPGQS